MRNGFRFAFFICVIRNLSFLTIYGLAPSTAHTCLPVHSCGNHTKFGTLFQNAIWHIYTILRNITTKNYCTNPNNPTNGGRGEQRSPAFIRLHGLYKFNPPQLLETGRRISAKQKLRCSPTGIRASFCRRKIAPLFADIRFALG